jgi:E3 ubiquitin-protein ligase listerin
VRELSHTLQFELMKSARKRMERHVPTIVGAWLAGIYDRDRAVARAANSGLSSFLTTPEKVVAFWRKCHSQILEYALSAVQETQDTLSDDRSTTKEDAETKYFRVVTASLSLVLGLLQKVDANEFEKYIDRYDDYFLQDNVWKSITFEDALARKTACHLLFVCLERKLPYATTTKAKQAFITGGLRTNQAGSALEYVRAVTKLTQSSPDIWTSSNEKKSPLTRLGGFVAKGSQGSPPKFWEQLDDLLSLLPAELLSVENASALLTSLKSGVTHREEPRTNTSPAWKCYIDTAQRLLKNLPPEQQLTFGRDHLFPLFEQFLFLVSGNTRSIPVGPNAMSVLVEAYVAVAGAEPPLVSAFAEEWDKLARVLRANISASLPEVSQEFRASQDKIAEESRRWFGLVGHLHGKLQSLEKSVPDHTATPSAGLISHSISLLATRNLKPFGAASLLEYALSTSPHLFGDEKWQEIFNFLYTTAQEDANKAIESPSSKYIFSCIRLLGSFNREDEYTKLWNSWLGAVLALDTGAARDDAIASLISHQKGGELSRGSDKLQETIVSQILATATSTEPNWDLLEAVIAYDILSKDAILSIAKALLSHVSKPQSKSENILKALELLVQGFPDLFKQNVDLHAALIAQLLSLTEIQEQSVSYQAAKVRALLDGQSDGQVPMAGVIHANLDRANANSLE